jgi:hypothetical protein
LERHERKRERGERAREDKKERVKPIEFERGIIEVLCDSIHPMMDERERGLVEET